MTIAMPDSITPGNMPMGYEAYLGYCDGRWPTAARLPALFPGAKVVSLTVTGGTLDADGIDVEPGNPTAKSGADWIRRKLAADPGSRPVAYASLASPGYSMAEVIAALLNLGIPRVKYRVLTAHYTGKAHICSPSACGAAFAADGTQWTSQFPGLNGSRIDMSLLADDFFGATAPATDWTETIMQQLPTVKQGQSGNVVRTVQGLCSARGHATPVDGLFGTATTAAVKAVQSAAKVTVDGIVGPVTWGKLLGV
jgi:peptidoglycan hydrolase-like protein with peptidoglycan-binding domain